ncbi:MAG: DMT family transporter [Coriobacteriia bacterium]|nr:DMT family transporter [Coriobacteriia bacterium]
MAAKGHLIALATVTVWGLTFVSTKMLLESFAPVEILLLRFALGFAALCVLSPRWLKLRDRKHELLFAAAGATGTFLYYLLENIALTFAGAGNIGMTVATAPLFTAILATILGRERALTPQFIAGFLLAMTGIALIGGQDMSGPNVLLGDALAIGAAIAWAVYSNVLVSLDKLGYGTIPTTKRIFSWGLLFIALASPLCGADPAHLAALADLANVGHLLFLGLGASAGCFVTWGLSVKLLGASTASTYIYLAPVITVIAATLILGEPMTGLILLGIVLVLGGLGLSSWKRAS